MPRKRRDVWKLNSDWDPTILWYARAVKVLKQRPFKDMTSWRYLAAMHGISEQRWKWTGYLDDNEMVPNTPAFTNEDRDQCQHHTWYFLPWHRGYLRAFEKIIASVVAQSGGPADWALPYWNYNDQLNPNRFRLPLAFASPSWPDGGHNPLFENARYGDTGISGAPIELDEDSVEVRRALIERAFDRALPGGTPGMGGAKTPFQHRAPKLSPGQLTNEGFLEQSPHDNVHGNIGGSHNNNLTDPRAPGLMSDPNTAALDPIFWLHHANIDRLWEVWRKRDQQNKNPTDSSWLDSPGGTRPFILPEPDNKTRTKFIARDMLDTTSPLLDYVYEDDSDPFPSEDRQAMRLNKLGFKLPIPPGAIVAEEPKVELLGAHTNIVRLDGVDTSANVRVDIPTGKEVMKSFHANELAARVTQEPDRVFLNLENITGSSDAVSFKVYVGLDPNQNPKDHPENLAGVVTLFGVSSASDPAGEHAGNGLAKTLEITHAVDQLHLNGAKELTNLPVRFVLRNGTQSDAKIGRISIYRQDG